MRLDRDIALTLGWIQSVLQKAILELPESTCPAAEKIEAVMAINKVAKSLFPFHTRC